MKKIFTAALALVMVFIFTSCGSGDSSIWESNVNDIFENVVVCKYGDVISADFGTAMNIKIKGTDYKQFIKYIDELKAAGFTFLQNGNVPENYNLYDGSAQWRCTDGDVYLQLIFAENDSTTYEMFGCNLQIYGYNDSSYLIPKKSSNKKDKNKTTETTEAAESEQAK